VEEKENVQSLKKYIDEQANSYEGILKEQDDKIAKVRMQNDFQVN